MIHDGFLYVFMFYVLWANFRDVLGRANDIDQMGVRLKMGRLPRMAMFIGNINPGTLGTQKKRGYSWMFIRPVIW